MNYISFFRFIDYYLGIILCFLFTLFRHLPKPHIKRKYKNNKILFIELSEMGSTILAYSAIESALENDPNADIYFLTFERNKSGVELLDLFNKKNILTVRDDSIFGLTVDSVKLLMNYYRIGFNICFDLELFSRFSVILSYLTGADKRIGFHNYTNEGLYRGDLLTHKVLYNPHIHISYNFLSLVSATFKDNKELPLVKESFDNKKISVPKVNFDHAKLKKYRDLFKSGKSVIVINPDSGPALPLRNWGLDKFSNLIERLIKEYDASIVLVGADISAESGEHIMNTVENTDNIFNMIGKTETILDLVHLIEASDLFITNDSGPGHFASLTKTPTFIFFGPETPELYRPIGENSIPIYSNFACSPCLTAYNHRRSICKRNRCLEVITPDIVMLKIARFM